MVDSIDCNPAEHDGSAPRSCPLCGDALANSGYPRHRITLEDEAEDTHNRLVNRRLCQACWQTFYASLSDETVPAASSFPLTVDD